MREWNKRSDKSNNNEREEVLEATREESSPAFDVYKKFTEADVVIMTKA